MFQQWSDFVGPQLNALVAIVALALIAIIGLLQGASAEVTIPCITGIAGIAGVLRGGDRPLPNGTTQTTITHAGGNGNGEPA